jgi:hypothetical protein
MKKIIRLTESDLKRIVKKVIQEQESGGSFLDKDYVEELKRDGYKEVPKVDLPDGTYLKGGGGYEIYLYGSDKKNTGYVLVTFDGIRGSWNGQPIKISNGTIAPDVQENEQGVYKILFNKNVVGKPLF